MPARRPANYTSLKTQMMICARNVHNLTRIEAAIKYMDKHVGRGWPRHMQTHDHYMDQDNPRLWVSGKKVAMPRTVKRFELYCARFGYVPPPEYLSIITPVFVPDVVAGLNALRNLEKPADGT